MRHATISAWQRDEDGSYSAAIDGWALHVRWRPESPAARRGFTWEASFAGTRIASEDLFEEIEVAMAHAEESVEARTSTATRAEPSDTGSHH